MKHKIIFGIVISILLVSLVYAGGSLLTKSDSTIKIEQTAKDTLTSKGIKDVNVKSTPMKCDDKECWTWVSQAGLINTEFRTSKSYCSSYSKLPSECINQTIPTGANCTVVCLSTADYTQAELQLQRDNFIKSRIEGYANSINPNTKSAETIIDDGGSVTEAKV